MSIWKRKKDEKTLHEGIHEATEDPDPRRLEESPPSEPGKPEAVNLDREEPVTDAARRREPAGMDAPRDIQRSPPPERADPLWEDVGRPSGASETTESNGSRDLQHEDSPIAKKQASAFLEDDEA